MLAAAPNSQPFHTGEVGQRMSSAGIHDAAGTALKPTVQINPQWAQQGTHMALRVPKIKHPAHLMNGAFTNAVIPLAPDNQTMVNIVKMSLIAGRVDADTIRYLADLRHHPIALWKATETQLGALVKDSRQQIADWFRTTLKQSIPLRESVQFVLAWHNEVPLAVSPYLIDHLQQMVRATPHCIGVINEVNEGLSNAAELVASELNHRLNIEPALNEQTNLYCGIGFMPYRDDETLIRIELDIMQMHLLPLLSGEGAEMYQDALYMALTLLSEHYLPLATPDDVAEIAMMFSEEAEIDINLIHDFMDDAGMDKNDELQVTEAIDALEGELFFVEEIGGYQFHREIVDDKKAVKAEWEPIKAVTSLEELTTRIKALPDTDDETLLRLRDWLTALADDLRQRMSDPEHSRWNETLADIAHQDDSYYHILIERNMVLTENYAGLYADAEQRHYFQMQDCDEEPIRLAPNADPKTVFRFCQQLREGTEWLARLHIAIDSEALA